MKIVFCLCLGYNQNNFSFRWHVFELEVAAYGLVERESTGDDDDAISGPFTRHASGHFSPFPPCTR